MATTKTSTWYHRFFCTTENDPFLVCIRSGRFIEFYLREQDETPAFATYDLIGGLLDVVEGTPIDLVFAVRSFVSELLI